MAHLTEMSRFDLELLIRWFVYRMDQDTRGQFMKEFPGVYNRLFGREIVKVVMLKNLPYRPRNAAAAVEV